MITEINGVPYRLKETRLPKRIGKMATMAMLMAEMSGSFHYYMNGPRLNYPKYHKPSEWLIEEYKRVQAKKSELSRKDRDLVEASFKHHFEIIPQNNQ